MENQYTHLYSETVQNQTNQMFFKDRIITQTVVHSSIDPNSNKMKKNPTDIKSWMNLHKITLNEKKRPTPKDFIQHIPFRYS